jgi:hypothetical protein
VNLCPDTAKSQSMDLTIDAYLYIFARNNQNGFRNVAEVGKSTDLVSSKMESYLDRVVEIPSRYAMKGYKCIPRTNIVLMDNRELQ